MIQPVAAAAAVAATEAADRLHHFCNRLCQHVAGCTGVHAWPHITIPIYTKGGETSEVHCKRIYVLMAIINPLNTSNVGLPRIQPNLAETAQHTGRMLKSNEENFKGLGTPAKVLQLLSAPTAERSVSFISSQLHM